MLKRDMGLIPGTHMAAHNQFQEPDTLFRQSQASGMHVVQRQIHAAKAAINIKLYILNSVS